MVQKPLKKFFTNNISLFVFGILFVFVLWYAISLGEGENNLIFTAPHETFKELGNLFADST